MSRITELEKQITELDERKVALQKELELEKAKTEIEYPFEERERYFVLCNDGRIANDCWEGYDCEFTQWSQGNIFKTKEAAKCERDRRALLKRFRQFRDKCNGDWKPDWKIEGNGGECYNIDLTYDDGKAELGTDWHRYFNPFCLFGYFKEQKDVNRAIELFGDEIKRLWVEE